MSFNRQTILLTAVVLLLAPGCGDQSRVDTDAEYEVPSVKLGRDVTLFMNHAVVTSEEKADYSGLAADSSSIPDPDLNEVRRQFNQMDWVEHHSRPTFTLFRSRNDRRFSLSIGRRPPPSDGIYAVWESTQDGEPFVVSCRQLRDASHALKLVTMFYTDDPKLYTAAKWHYNSGDAAFQHDEEPAMDGITK